MAAHAIEINGRDLSSDTVLRVARGVLDGEGRVFPPVILARQSRSEIARVRQLIERECLGPDARPTYGLNTGCGKLNSIVLSPSEIEQFNSLYTKSHCVAVGERLSNEVVRSAIIIRANQLASGYSGTRPELVEALLDLLNAGVTPVVLGGGSLGASGDLAPLSYIGAVLIGEPRARAIYRQAELPAPEALAAAGLKPIGLMAKEGMALNNGATVSLGQAVLTEDEATAALETANITAALSLEAIRGETGAFDARIHDARGFPNQRLAAARIRQLLNGSSRVTEDARRRWLGAPQDTPTNPPPRVQDAYSFRCIAQVHGSTYDALDQFRNAISGDLNSAVDNPLVFASSDYSNLTSLSGGNFLGLQLAQSADLMAIALVKLAQASERRTFRLLNPSLSFQLPEQLTGSKPGLNTGLMIAQYTQASLINECAVLASPASIHPAVTSGGQEDLASMSLFAVRKLNDIVARVQTVIAIELLCAVQGITLTQSRLGNPRLGSGTEVALQVFRECVPELGEDRFLHDDVVAAIDLVRLRRMLEKAECLPSSNKTGTPLRARMTTEEPAPALTMR